MGTPAMGRSTLPGRRVEASRAGMMATTRSLTCARVKRVGSQSVSLIFGAGDIQVDDDRFLAAADDDCFHRLVLARVQLLMGGERRDVHKISRSGLIDKFEMLSPTEAGA